MTEAVGQIVESVASGVLGVDREQRIVFFNRAFAKSSGLRLEEWRGRSTAELSRALSGVVDRAPLERLLATAATPGGPRVSYEFAMQSGETVRWLRGDSRAWRDPRGQVQGRTFAFHDISQEKAVDRMKTEFIAVASHELRTPMTSIKGSIDLILSGFAGSYSADAQELLEIAHKSCDRLIRLINDILDLAKIEAGQIKLKLGPIAVDEVAGRAISSVRSLAESSEVRLTLEAPEGLPEIEADKDRVEQVITNLLSNAIKYSPAKGEVRTELSYDGEWVQCCIRDQGCGIAPEDLPKVFGKFQQVGETRNKGGTGLGLAICQALVLEHRGTLWVESEVNQGARFIFRLPAARAPQEATAKAG